jgi:hypothetical protein
MGDVLEVDSGVLQVGDEAAARSEAGVEAVASSKAGDDEVACFGLGLRMAGGGHTTVSTVTEEREHLAILKNC